jgi:hypothetical protein
MFVSRNNSGKFSNIDNLKESLSSMSKNSIDFCFIADKKNFEFRQMNLALTAISQRLRMVPEVSRLPVVKLSQILPDKTRYVGNKC